MPDPGGPPVERRFASAARPSLRGDHLRSTCLAALLLFAACTKDSSSEPVAWDGLAGKPATFPTTWAQVADPPATYATTWDQVAGKPVSFPTTLAEIAD